MSDRKVSNGFRFFKEVKTEIDELEELIDLINSDYRRLQIAKQDGYYGVDQAIEELKKLAQEVTMQSIFHLQIITPAPNQGEHNLYHTNAHAIG